MKFLQSVVFLLFTLLQLLVFSISQTIAQEPVTSNVSPEKQEQWISKTSKEFRSFVPDTSMPATSVETLDLGDFKMLSCRVNQKGIIQINDKDWIYIVTTSSHNDEETGDISLAVDNRGRIYINYGHVCGGIIHFQTDKIPELKTTRDFFRNFVSDTDTKSWEKL